MNKKVCIIGCAAATVLMAGAAGCSRTEEKYTDGRTPVMTAAANALRAPLPAAVNHTRLAPLFSGVPGPVFIRPQGMNLEERFPAPDGYVRTEAPEGSFQSYMRGLPLKPDGSPVMLYDGTEKYRQDVHAAVFAMPVFDSDLQQCADSVIRVYAEYFWASGNYDKAAFHLTNGFLMDYPSWRDGNRLLVDGNHVSWTKKASYDDSYETFLLYLKYVMMYAGTLSLDEESTAISREQIQAGDMFIRGGSPGHCVMVADVAVNDSGQTCFLLAQGYMPAQDFHILKNPAHSEDPWYYTEMLEYPFVTPEYVFQEGSLKRWSADNGGFY